MAWLKTTLGGAAQSKERWPPILMVKKRTSEMIAFAGFKDGFPGKKFTETHSPVSEEYLT